MPPVLTRHASSNPEGVDIAEPLSVDLKAANITLYEFNESPPCWKVRALLHYYGVAYKSVTAYPGSKIEGLDNSYAKIPKLVVDDTQINDSAVIFRTLSPLLTGEKLTAEQIDLENRNNIAGLLGALEKELISSYWGIAAAVSALTRHWKSPLKGLLPYVAGTIMPVTWMLSTRMPHGRDGSSLEHGRVYREALGQQTFFHGDSVGPLDLSLYGTFACFLNLGSPHANAVLDQCELRQWYERVDETVRAIRPLMG